MKLHALVGLPRAGSTLLANVLSQHPDIYVSGTSALSQAVDAVVTVLSGHAEIQADLANVPGSYDRYRTALRQLAHGWYCDRTEAHVIDKGRGWITQRALLEQIEPGSTMIVTVRDPRDVIASIERKHRQTAIFHSPVASTIYDAADLLMKQDGMVGGPMKWIEDVIRRAQPGVVWVRYEQFVTMPDVVVATIHKALGLDDADAFVHDFDGVENVATDLDALYRNKYPHDGSGRIKPSGQHWSDILDPQLAANIAGVFPFYMQTFGYDQG